MNKLDCEIVQDLLPSYIENLTSDYTRHEVEEHLKTCNACRTICMGMCENIEEEQELNEEQKKIQTEKGILFFLRKVKLKAFRKGVVLAVLVAVVLAGIFGYNEYWQNYRVAVPPEAVNCEAYYLEDGAVYMTLTVSDEYRVTGWEDYRDGDTHYITAQVLYKPTLDIILNNIFYPDLPSINQRNYVFTKQELDKEILQVVYREGDFGPYQITHREKVLYDTTQTLPVLEETPEFQPWEFWDYNDMP